MVKEDQIKLMQAIIDQQEKRIQEKDAVIADLRKWPFNSGMRPFSFAICK